MRKEWSEREVEALRRKLRAGMTHAEIAYHLGRSESSVKNKAISQAVFNDQPKLDRRHAEC